MVEPGEKNVHLRTHIGHYLDPFQITGHVLYVDQNSDDHIRAVLFNRMAVEEEAMASLNQNSKNILSKIRDAVRTWQHTVGAGPFDAPPPELLDPSEYRTAGGRSIRTKQTRKSRKSRKSRKTRKSRKSRKSRKTRNN